MSSASRSATWSKKQVSNRAANVLNCILVGTAESARIWTTRCSQRLIAFRACRIAILVSILWSIFHHDHNDRYESEVKLIPAHEALSHVAPPCIFRGVLGQPGLKRLMKNDTRRNSSSPASSVNSAQQFSTAHEKSPVSVLYFLFVGGAHPVPPTEVVLDNDRKNFCSRPLRTAIDTLLFLSRAKIVKAHISNERCSLEDLAARPTGPDSAALRAKMRTRGRLAEMDSRTRCM